MSWNHIDASLWAIFGLVWLIAAPFSRRTVQGEGTLARLGYGIPLVVGVVLVFSTRAAQYLPWLGARLLPDDGALGLAGTATTAVGIGFAFWARVHLGRMWSGSITLKEDHRLIDTGPYRLARHPIYTGMILGLAGGFLTAGTVGAALGAVLVAASFVVKLGREERLMAAHFGQEHAAYRARVKRLVPFVW